VRDNFPGLAAQADPQQLLTALTTEHFTLQGARSQTVSESASRASGEDRGGLLTTRGKGSGVETQVRLWYVVWITNGKVTRRQVFLDRDEALEAAGLSE
jgi:hypothetical protein